MWSVYKPDSETFRRLKALATSRNPLKQLSHEDAELCHHARILVPERWGPKRAKHGRLEFGRMCSDVKRNLHTVARSMIHPLQIGSMRHYFRALEAQGYMSLDRNQVKFHRYYIHNDPVMQFVHRQSGNLVRAITGEQIIPSYSFLSAYLKGARLKKHVDRPQCLWNGSLLIDQNPETDLEKSWPIYLESPNRTSEIRLDFGDALFYSGTKIPHWRKSIGRKNRQTLGLLHYVPIDFNGDLD